MGNPPFLNDDASRVAAATMADDDEDRVDNDNTNNSKTLVADFQVLTEVLAGASATASVCGRPSDESTKTVTLSTDAAAAKDSSGAVDVSEDMDNDIDADEGDDTWTCEVSKWQDGLAMLAEYPRKVIVLRFPWTPARFQRVFGKRGHASLINGRVHIFELPSNPHEAITSRIVRQVVGRNNTDVYLTNDATGDCFKSVRRQLENMNATIDQASMAAVSLILSVLYLRLDRPDGIRGVLSVINRRSRDADIQKDQLVAVWYQFGDWDAQTGSPVPSFAISFGNRLHWRTKRAIERRCAVTGDNPVASVLWHGCTDPEMVAMQVANTAAL